MSTKKNDLTYLYGVFTALYSIPKRSICDVDAEGFPCREGEATHHEAKSKDTLNIVRAAIAAHPGFRSTINLV